jgi:hypothetical protein
MFYWLHDLPTWGMVLLISSVFLAITWLGTLFIRPVLRAFLRSQPDRATYVSYLLGSHGVYFGILLGPGGLRQLRPHAGTGRRGGLPAGEPVPRRRRLSRAGAQRIEGLPAGLHALRD